MTYLKVLEMNNYYLIFGSGKNNKEQYKLRTELRKGLEIDGKKVVFPEDFDNLKTLEEKTEKLRNLGISQVDSENIFNLTELERVLIKNSHKTFIIMSSPGSIAEFSQFFDNDETKNKIFLFIPHKHFGTASFINEQVMKFVFKPPRGIAWPYHDSNEIIQIARQYLSFPIDIIKINKEEILNDFFKWKENLMTNMPDMSLDKDFFKRKPEDMVLSDWFFICIIPTTISKDLIDFSSDSINSEAKIEFKDGVIMSGPNPNHIPEIGKFFESYHVLGYSQVYCINQFLQEYNDLGNIIRVYRDGKIFICLRYGPQFKVKDKPELRTLVEKSKHNRKIFDIEPLFMKRQPINREKAQEKYGTPIKNVMPGNLEHIFKIVCFPFHKDCKVQMVRTTTTKFKAYFLFPNMKKNNLGRILYQRNRIGPVREYLADDDELFLHLDFEYENIPSMLNIFKRQCLNDFKNPRRTFFA